MRALPKHSSPVAVLSLLLGFTACASTAAESPESAGRVSRRISDAILADFRKVEVWQPTAAENDPPDAEPGVVVLHELQVQARRDVELLSPASLKPPTEAIPIWLGTGITEYRGKKFSVMTQRVLFIPVGFKLAW